MSSSAALLLLLLGTPAGPMPDGMPFDAPSTTCAPGARTDAIVVCGRVAGPSPRLPFREDRAEAGADVRYASDGPRGDPGPRATPSQLMGTIGTLFRHARAAMTGADPD